MTDRRAEHIQKILAKDQIDQLFVGVPNGPMGLAQANVDKKKNVCLQVNWGIDQTKNTPAYPLKVIVGMCRPQTCRKILREAASLGIMELAFFASEKGEKGYLNSSLWKTDEWKRQLLEGVEQAFSTHVPVVHQYPTMEEAISNTQQEGDLSIGLDNYEATDSLELISQKKNKSSVLLAIGSERGWSDQERNLLRTHHFTLTSMGHKVMRTETALIAGCSMIAAANGWFASH